MTQVIAKLNNVRIAPRKMRFITELIKGMPVDRAEAQLLFNKRRPSDALLILLRSAKANAKNKNMNTEKLFIKRIIVDQGTVLKRFLPRAMGRATPLNKRSSHVTLELAERETIQRRFSIVPPPKKTKADKEKKAPKVKPALQGEKQQPKPEKKPSFLKRLFRRKSV